MPAANQYQTALLLQHARPTYTPDTEDAERITAYWTYEDIWRNVPSAFEVLLRDADGEEIGRRYVPAARTIIEATNRYLCKNMEFTGVVPPDVTLDQEAVDTTMAQLEALFTREEVGAKFLSMKRWTLIRGDGILHLSADPLKPEGSRLRITELSPEHYFPLRDPVDTERVIGAYIVTVMLDGDTEIVQRVEYRKIVDDEMAAKFGTPIGNIFYRLSFWEPEGWDDRFPRTEADLKSVDVPAALGNSPAVTAALDGQPLPASITSVPIYHFRNNREGSKVFGASELAGIETLLAGITQVVTDEDVAVALQGIGVYWTDSGRPVDKDGREVDWMISPASLLELQPGAKMGRLSGANDIKSLLEHSDALKAHAQEATSTPDVAVGRVDVKVAESGVALAIQMSPVTSKNGEKEEEAGNKMDQMVYDIVNGWWPAYESIAPNGLVIRTKFADPLPVNRVEIVKEITELVKAKVISAQYGAKMLVERLGYTLDPVLMAAEVAGEAEALLDMAGARMTGELGAGGGGDNAAV